MHPLLAPPSSGPAPGPEILAQAGGVGSDAASSGASPAGPPGELLGRLRSPHDLRPPVDPGLAGGLRAWLEDGVAASACGSRVTIRPDGGGRVVAVPARRVGERHTSPELVTALLRTVFRLTVTAGTLRAPFEDALAALAVDEAGDAVVRAVQALPRHRRAQMRERVRVGASLIARDWSPPPRSWLARTAEPLVAPLGGGRVELRADADLVLGAPSAGRASVCVLHVQLASPPMAEGAPRRFLALLETLRSGAAPFRAATYDLGRNRLSVDDVTDDVLARAVRDVLDLVNRAQARRRASR